MFFQFMMCTGIWTVGLIVNLVREQPEFQPFAMLGGVLWATGNVMCVPIIKTIGMGMGQLIWGTANCCIGWATGAFGLFGLPEDCTPCTTCHNQTQPGAGTPADCTINHGRNIAGFVVVLAALAAFIQVKSDGSNKLNKSASASSDGDDAESQKQQPLLSDGAVGAPEDEEAAEDSWVDNLPEKSKRPVGIAMAVVAGLFFGSCFNPPTYIMKHNGEGQHYAGASSAGLDYVWSQFCGIYIASIFWLLVYCAAMKNTPIVYPRIILPGFMSGFLWAIAQFSWFVANDCLSFSVSFPVITSGPGLIAAGIGIYYGEIFGKKNFLMLGTSIVLTIIADALIATSRTVIS